MHHKYGLPPEMSATDRLAERLLEKRRRLLKRSAIVVAALLGFLLTRSAFGPDPAVVETFPSEVIGRWETDDPRYRDRAMVIFEDELQLHLAPGQATVHRVQELRRTEEGDDVVYDFSYYTSAGTAQLELRVRGDGTATLKNPSDVVWTRSRL